jgi:CO/xanthine dehydrogenase FAD-binding subunit
VAVQDYVLAESPAEATRLLAADPEAILIGGGTTVMPRATAGELGAERAVGLVAAGLDYVRGDADGWAIGAMTPLQVVAELPEPAVLAAAARAVGGWALRTTATVGGNLFVDPPYGDLVPVLLALDAELELLGPDGGRVVPIADAEPVRGSILVEVRVPALRGIAAYRRSGRRTANSPAVAAAAVRVLRGRDTVVEARVALGAVGRAARSLAAEEVLVGSAGEAEAVTGAAAAAAAACEPATDAVASAWYRRRMVELHVRRALEAALGDESAP